MNRSFSAVIVAVMLFGGASHAAQFVYAPPTAELTIPAGASKTVPATVGIEDIESNRTYYTWYRSMVSGDLPEAWITVSPANGWLTSSSPSAGVIYTVTVPEGTPSGSYASSVFAKGMASHKFADPGSGLLVMVTVPSLCSGIPKLVDMAISPETIWPPNHRMDVVTVTGRVEYPDGCGLLNFGYSIEDEYNIHTATGTASVDAERKFTFTVPVEASREGQDKDGRHYRITVLAEDEAGVGMSETFTAIVPHDKREK